MSAAAQLSGPTRARSALTPAGIPVDRGRVHLGRLRQLLEVSAASDRVAVVAGFGTAVWLGPLAAANPNLGRLVYRAFTQVDARGRVVLDRRVRGWLGVADPMAFEVVIVPASPCGLLVVPVEDFAHRWEVIAR